MKAELIQVIESQKFINSEHEKQKQELTKLDNKIKAISTESSQQDIKMNRLKKQTSKINH